MEDAVTSYSFESIDDPDSVLSAEYRAAKEKWPRGHPELFKAAIREFRDLYEPEFLEEIRRARHSLCSECASKK